MRNLSPKCHSGFRDFQVGPLYVSVLQQIPTNFMSELSDVNFIFLSEGMSSSGNEGLDQSSEGWVASCFNDSQMHLSPEDMYVISFA